ncbi:EpsG family protein [Vibrio breoganii]|uniref:EpsG family protein n=1 Tax=Vibrio breoganii TaxID=553239 RepID=UPI0021C34D3A|nr:EpsG family protein [Vibrio breoganii]MDN3715954.1 EpsG family protein [Vibrio breoganii]
MKSFLLMLKSDKSENDKLIIFLLFLSFNFLASVNGLRSGVSMYALIYFITLYESKSKLSIFALSVAIIFHSFALVVLFTWYISRNFDDHRLYKLVLLFCFVASLLKFSPLDYFASIFLSEPLYNAYFGSGLFASTEEFSLATILMSKIPWVIIGIYVFVVNKFTLIEKLSIALLALALLSFENVAFSGRCSMYVLSLFPLSLAYRLQRKELWFKYYIELCMLFIFTILIQIMWSFYSYPGVFINMYKGLIGINVFSLFAFSKFGSGFILR